MLSHRQAFEQIDKISGLILLALTEDNNRTSGFSEAPFHSPK